MNNWTVKEHQIGAQKVCVKKDRHEIVGAEKVGAEKTWAQQ